MRIPLSPPPNTEGLFIVNQPFTLDSSVIFKVEAIRTFPELARRGTDVYNEYYVPVGITKEDYLLDTDVNAAIVTFKSRDGQIVYIPNTYIESYPGQSGYVYNRNVVILDLNLVPDTVDITLLKDDLKSLVQASVGVEVDAEIVVMRYEGTVSEADHIRMEALRIGKIREATPLSQQVADLTKRNEELQAYTDSLVKILQDQGLAN